MLEADTLSHIPIFLGALDIAKHLLVPAQELLCDYLHGLLVFALLLSLINLCHLQRFKLLSSSVALALQLMADIVQSLLDGLSAMSASSSRGRSTTIR